MQAPQEARYQALVEAQEELISLARPDGQFVYVNAAYARYFGQPVADLVRRNLYELVPPEDVPQVRALIDGVLCTGEVGHGENRMIGPDGSTRWMAWTNCRHVDAGGETLLHSVGRDTTLRRELQERLAQSERLLRQVADALPVRIAYVDRDQRYRFVNAARAARLGRPVEQIVGRTRRELKVAGSDPQMDRRAAAALRGHAQHFEFDEEVGGTLHRFEGHMLPDLADDGAVLGYFSTAIDITERAATERALRELTQIFEASPDYVVQTDWRGDITYMNPATRRALGLPPDGPVPPMNFTQLHTAETNRLFAEVIGPHVRKHGSWIGNTTVLADKHRVLPVSHMVLAHRDDSGRVERYSGVMRDISRQVADQIELDRQAATLRSVSEAIPAAVAVVGVDQRYRFVNSAFERWVGATRERIVGRSVPEVIGRLDYERSRAAIEQVLGGETVNFERDYDVGGVRRHLAVTYVPMWTEGGRVDGFVGVLIDISEHRRTEGHLRHLTQIDALTGLLNRTGLEQALREHIAAGQGPNLALLFVDLDRFKAVNDAHGHAAGDQVLIQVAQRLRALVRPSDAVSRLGGDEFVLLLPGVRELAHAEGVAAKIVAAAAVPFAVGQLQVSIGASVGIGFGAADEDGTGAALLQRADELLYAAKKLGRGTYASD